MEIPGADLPGVMTLRGWADSRAIRGAAQGAKKAVVVGAGFIGMEVAASLAGHDVEVTVVERESTPLEKQLGREVGEVIRKLHEENGTVFRLGRTVERFQGDDKVQGVELDDGERLLADLVVVGLGITPVTEFLQGVPVNDDRSVDVDSRLMLAENVYAAGDVARYPDPFSDDRIRIEHWRLAQQHGRTAGQTMAGKDVSFESVPFFWTRHFGVSLMYAGHATEWDEVLMTGEPAKQDFTAFYIRDNRLLAAAGTQAEQIIAFIERMRTGQLPQAEELRHQPTVDLLKGLKRGAGDSEPSIGGKG